MSTNYYWEPTPDACECCKRDFERLMIGKLAGGWRFLFRGYDTETVQHGRLMSYADWREHFSSRPGLIVDEYGRTYTPNELDGIVGQSRKGRNHSEEYPDSSTTVDAEGWPVATGEWS